MKKWYRIGICLVLTICLLLLTACQGEPAVSSNDPTQITETNIENNTSSPDSLAWNYTLLNTFAGIQSTAKLESSICRLTYETWLEAVASNQEWHKGCQSQGSCVMDGSVECVVLDYFENTPHLKSTFAEKTVLMVNFNVDINNPATVKDIRYDNNTVTCTVELDRPIRRDTKYHRTIYLQTDTLLPADTQLKLEITTKDQQNKNTVALKWEESFFSLSGDWKLWEKDAPKIANLLTYDSYQKLVAECIKRGSAYPTYSEEFFQTHSLIVLGLSSGSGSTIFEVYDLHYTPGVLTCSVDTPYAKGLLQTANMASWFCFIEVDTVLAAETTVVLDCGSVEYDYETYMQKHTQFHETCHP